LTKIGVFKRRVYGQPEVLSTATYSVGSLLAEDDEWTRVDMHEGAIANIRRALAAGEAALAIEMAATVRDGEVIDVAVIVRTGEVPDVFVREKA
jgi:hypothetical protein